MDYCIGKKRWLIKEEAMDLRRNGLTYGEIRNRIPISKSTISEWCKNIELTKKQIARLDAKQKIARYSAQLKGAKTNRLRRAREIEKLKLIAKREISPLSSEDLKIAGLMLYWAEGHKSKSNSVGVSNSDPKLIKFMMAWFRKICCIPNSKFRIQLHLHSGQGEERMKKYWMNITDIPRTQFIKSYIKKEGSGHRKNKLYNGTVNIKVSDSNLFHRIQGWLEALQMD